MRLRWRWRRSQQRSPRHRHRVSHEFQNDGIGSGAAVTNLASYASRPSPVDRRHYVWEGGALGQREGERNEAGAGQTLFTFYSHAANLTGGRAHNRDHQPRLLPSTLSPLSYTDCPSFPYPLIYIQTYLSTSLSINPNSIYNSFYVPCRRFPTPSASCMRINRSKRCRERGCTSHTGLQLARWQWNSWLTI